jgi:hypothetical protein
MTPYQEAELWGQAHLVASNLKDHCFNQDGGKGFSKAKELYARLGELLGLLGMKKQVKDNYPDGICPDCGEPIPDDAEDGSACENCDHVFWGA